MLLPICLILMLAKSRVLDMVFDDRPQLLVSTRPGILAAADSASRFTPRHALRLACMCLIICLATAPTNATEPSVRLQSANKPGTLTRVQAVVEVSGELKLNPDGKQVTKLPLKGKGELTYDERLIQAGSREKPRRDVRCYRQAEARFAVGDGEIVSQLSPERRCIGVQSSSSQSLVFSLLNPLTRDELELIDVQGSSSVLHRLLPDKDVEIGEKWSLHNEAVAVLLRLDVVTENKLECELKKIEEQVAYVELSGSASGSIGGVPSDLELTAKFNFDLPLQRITWLAMSIHENRSIGHAEPGFDVTARVRVAVNPLDASPDLAEESLAKLSVVDDQAATFLTCTTADGAFRFIYPRTWRVMVDRHDVTVMRLIDGGEMIAQCNLSKLPDAAPDKFLSMETFQADIQRSLAKSFGEFVEAKQFKTDRGLRAMRVVVAGVASELPIQWVYYHITDEKGRQGALVFTMDAKVVERFGGEDQTILSGLEILPTPASKTQDPKPAAQTASDKKPDAPKAKR